MFRIIRNYIMVHLLYIAVFTCWMLSMCATPVEAQHQEADAFFIKAVYEHALEKQTAFNWLHYLSENIGGRIAGSPQSMAAIEYCAQVLDTLGSDTVWKQPCTVDYWYRGEKEECRIVSSQLSGSKTLKCLALGGSSSTAKEGIAAEVLEFHSLEEIRQAGKSLKGKIVFLNRHFDNKPLRTFHGYGAAVDQRVFGPREASKAGAVACVIRSMTGRIDDVPHTGSTIFDEGIPAIPCIALSTRDADVLSANIKAGPVKLFVKTSCEHRGLKESYSVIGEIKGSEKPNEIILVGGHLDSWDVGGGAHDDGAGCVHAMEVFYLLKQMNYKPKRTIRCVLFQNEENGLAGGRTYAQISNEKREYHLAAIESDAGGFTPQGFTFDADTSVFAKLIKNFSVWEELLAPYHISFDKGESGADIGPLKSQKGLLIGLSPDSQRYFDYHHTAADRIDAVHPRELALGSAAMASLVFLIDKHGLRE